MHRKYGDKGVVAMSVTVDLPEQRDAALRFLKKQGATFPNYWLDEEQRVWQERFGINGPPVVFVYDQTGKEARRIDSDTDKPYDVVEKFVKELIKAPN